AAAQRPAALLIVAGEDEDRHDRSNTDGNQRDPGDTRGALIVILASHCLRTRHWNRRVRTRCGNRRGYRKAGDKGPRDCVAEEFLKLHKTAPCFTSAVD